METFHEPYDKKEIQIKQIVTMERLGQEVILCKLV